MDLSRASFLKEKNEMRTRHVAELRPLEKKVKQQKGVYREKAEQLLLELKQKHHFELLNLEKKFDINTEKKKIAQTAESESTTTNKNFSKRLDLLKSPAPPEVEEKNKLPTDNLSEKVSNVGNTAQDKQDVESDSNVSGEESEEKNDDSYTASEESDDVGSVRDNVEDNLDIPDSQKLLGSGREDLRSKRKKFPNMEIKKQKNTTVDDSKTQRMKQNTQETVSSSLSKREKVVQAYLLRVLNEFPEGLRLDSITQEFEKIKLKSFSPDLLGYKDLEDWILHQPAHVVKYDSVTDMIFQGQKKQQNSNRTRS